MKKTLLFTGALTVATLLLIYPGCKKDKDDDTNDDNNNPPVTQVDQTAKDNATSEAMANDALKQVDNSAKANPAAGGKGGDNTLICATITFNPPAWPDPTIFPKTMKIDFGSSNCLCVDGIYRRGIINTGLTKPYNDSGAVATISFDQYYVSDYKVEGTITITNLGHSGTYGTGGNQKYQLVVDNFKVTIPDGSKYSLWNSNRTREWVAGESTPYPNVADDDFVFDGTASGTDINGVTYTVNITKPLYYAMSCVWIKSGTVDIIPANLPTRTIDWGNGTCDNQATLTISGVTIPFTLP